MAFVDSTSWKSKEVGRINSQCLINDEFLLGKKRADYSALLKYTGGSGIDWSAHSHFLSGGTLVERQSLNEHVNKNDLAVVNFTYGMLEEYLWNF